MNHNSRNSLMFSDLENNTFNKVCETILLEKIKEATDYINENVRYV